VHVLRVASDLRAAAPKVRTPAERRGSGLVAPWTAGADREGRDGPPAGASGRDGPVLSP
jgi:hypothetical protein